MIRTHGDSRDPAHSPLLQSTVTAAGGFTWSQFVSITAPPNNSATCTAFFDAACVPDGGYYGVALKQSFTEGPGRVFDPLPAFEQDLATFLLVRICCMGDCWGPHCVPFVCRSVAPTHGWDTTGTPAPLAAHLQAGGIISHFPGRPRLTAMWAIPLTTRVLRNPLYRVYMSAVTRRL